MDCHPVTTLQSFPLVNLVHSGPYSTFGDLKVLSRMCTRKTSSQKVLLLSSLVTPLAC